MNDANSYAYQNRVLLGQIAEMLAKNMAVYQSASAPFANSTYRLPMGFSHPTMFAQLQGAVSSVMGEEIGGFMGLLANPAIRAMLPAPVNETLTTLMNAPQMGGISDPAAFLLNNVARGIGRNVPTISVPFDFTNTKATDAYIAQAQAFTDYAGQVGFNAGAPTAVEALSMDQKKQNLNKIIAARNAIRVQQENSSFSNTFELFNNMNVFGPRVDTDALIKDLTSIQDESQASKFLDQSENKDKVEALLKKSKEASGLMSIIDYFSNYMGSNSAENTAMRSFGDAIRDAFNIGNNNRTFIPGVSQSIANIGGLNIAMATGAKGENIPVANILAARLSSAVEGTNPNGNFETVERLGFRRTQDLISTLSNSGMVSTGGVDIYGSLKEEDVKKMEEAMLRQLEGFGKIAETGKRLGLRTEELIQNLQSIYGGRTNEVLNTKANAILQDLETNVVGGISKADALINEENARRASNNEVAITGDEERKQFLRLEAQRRAGAEMGKDLAKTVQLGKMAGIDAKGTMAMVATATQILQNMGITGEGSFELARHALTYTAMSANTGGTPITNSQGLAMAAGSVAVSQEDPSVTAFGALMQGVENDRVKLEDPRVQAIIKKFKEGETLDEGEIAKILGGDDVYRFYAQQSDQHMGKIIPYILERRSTDVPKFYEDSIRQFNGGEQLLGKLGPNLVVAINDIHRARKMGQSPSDIKKQIMQQYNVDEQQAQLLYDQAVNRNISVAGMPLGIDSRDALEVRVEQLAFQQRHGLDSLDTAVGIFADAQVKFSEDLEKRLSAKSTGQSIKQNFEAIRTEKIKKLTDAGVTQADAEKQVNDEGYNVNEFIEAFSSMAKPEALQALSEYKVEIESQLKKTTNTKEKLVLEKVLENINAAEKGLKDKPVPTAPTSSPTPPTAPNDPNAGSGTAGQTNTGNTGQVNTGNTGQTNNGTVTNPNNPNNPGTTGGGAASPTPPASGLTPAEVAELKAKVDAAVSELQEIKKSSRSIEDRIILSGF